MSRSRTATRSSFTGSGSSYTVVVTPNADADVTVTVDADSATDGTNTGPPADVVATAVFGAPAAPSVTATAGNGQVTLSWTNPSDDTITGYEYQQREEGGTWPNGWTSIANSASLTEYAVTGLTNGTAYEFQVRAVSDAVMGTPSGTVSATPLAATAPGRPRDLRAAPGGGQVVLNWRVPGTNGRRDHEVRVPPGNGRPSRLGCVGGRLRHHHEPHGDGPDERHGIQLSGARGGEHGAGCDVGHRGSDSQPGTGRPDELHGHEGDSQRRYRPELDRPRAARSPGMNTGSALSVVTGHKAGPA